ncbi:MAG: DMT family transporter [Oscillospiraceae bacterium]|jgi:drug/metabolite transporter (DMT)-like permease|nr:DMT family transporter [Oscillospiraceae bacterium]
MRREGAARAGYLALMLLVCVVFGYSFIVVKNLLTQGFPLFLLLGLRFLLGGVLLLCLRPCRAFGGRTPLRRDEFRCGALLGAVTFAAYVLQTVGVGITTPAKNGLFTGLYVIFVPLLLMAARRVWTPRPLFAAAVGFAGVLLISNVLFERFSLNAGDLLSVFCAVALAVQIVLLGKYAPSVHPVNFTAIQLFVSSALSLFISFVREQPFTADIPWAETGLGLLFLGVFPTGFCAFAQTFVQARLPAASVAVVLCTESVFAVLFSALLGYDRITVAFLAGAALMVASMFLSATGKPIRRDGARMDDSSV